MMREGETTSFFHSRFILTLVIWLLLVVAAASASSGLAEVVRGLNPNPLLLISTAALILGWALGGSIRQAWASFSMLFLLGLLLVILIYSGSGYFFLSAVINCGNQAVDAGVFKAHGFVFAFPAIVNLLGGFNQVFLLFIRLGNWISSVRSGNEVTDLAVINLLWASVLWPSFAWMAWSIRRRFTTIAAILPALALLSAVLAYVHREAYGLLGFLGASLIMMVVIERTNREADWSQKGTDFSVETRMDMAIVVIPICSAVLLAAAIFPSISFRKLADNIHHWMEREDNAVSAPFPGSVGLHAEPPEAQPIPIRESPGLPRSHLIGSGPELSQIPVMRIVTEELPSISYDYEVRARSYYWRGATYDGYTGQGWVSSSTASLIFDPDKQASQILSPHRKLIRQTVDLLDDLGNIVFASGDLISINQQYMVAFRSQNDPFVAGVEERHYSAVSHATNVTAEELRAAGKDYPDWIRQRYLRLPESIPVRVQSLALNVTAPESTPYDKARAIEELLRQYPYNLDLPAPPKDRDIVDYFLFDLREGYCDYYATAMVVLARAAGIPARMAVGYASGQYDSLNAAYIVSQADAHSWPELYFPGYGWIEFEPTANRTTRAVITSGYSRQPVTTIENQPDSESSKWQEQIKQILFLTAAVVILYLFFRWCLKILHEARMGPHRVIDSIYGNIIRMADLLSIHIPNGSTPYEVGGELINGLAQDARGNPVPDNDKISANIKGLLDLYVNAQYSPRPLTRADASRARKSWRSLKRQLWGPRISRALKKRRVKVL